VPEDRVQRRLAAIMAADVVNYSALMERADETTYANFEQFTRELVEPSLSRNNGRLIKTTGDGALAEFASPLAAVRSAMEIQDGLASGHCGLRLCIGIQSRRGAPVYRDNRVLRACCGAAKRGFAIVQG
jgi:adenylate cyclase